MSLSYVKLLKNLLIRFFSLYMVMITELKCTILKYGKCIQVLTFFDKMFCLYCDEYTHKKLRSK